MVPPEPKNKTEEEKAPPGQVEVKVTLPPYPEEPDDPTEVEALGNLLASWGEEAGYVEVYRFDGKGGRQFLCRYGADTFDAPTLQNDFGGGKYQVRIFNAKKKYLGAQTIDIWGAPKEVEKTPEGANLATLYTEGKEEIRTLIEELKNPPAQAGEKNYMELALSVVSSVQDLQKPFLEALLNKTGSGEVGVSEVMEAFFKGMEVRENMAPESDPYAGVVKAFLPPITKALAAGQPAAAAGPTLQPNPPEERPGPVVAPSRPPWDLLLTSELPRLQRWAAAGKDAQLRAAVVVDDLPPEALPLVTEQLARGEEFLQEFFQLHPETVPFQEWYRAFFRYMFEEFDWAEREEEEEGEEGGEEEGQEDATQEGAVESTAEGADVQDPAG